jgi:hypothetical protein
MSRSIVKSEVELLLHRVLIVLFRVDRIFIILTSLFSTFGCMYGIHNYILI